jgi:hypothetical protein
MDRWGVEASIFVLLLMSAGGCTTPPLATVAESPPWFEPLTEDRTQLAAAASELDALAMECAVESACEDRVHFARGLVNLFENRDAARASFEQVISLHPSSPFAASSALWLQLLREDRFGFPSANPQQRVLMDMTAHSVRELLARRALATRPTKMGAAFQGASVQALAKQVQDRERRIAELRSQLDALKVIDQDQHDRQRLIKPPAALLPKTTGSVRVEERGHQ